MMDINDSLKDTARNSKDKLENSSEYEYVMAFKHFNRNENGMPSDFDTWIVKEQCNWINQNITKFFPNVPQSLLSYIPGAFYQLNYDRSSEKLPEWMDMNKYQRGQQFIHKHFTALIVSKLVGLMYSFSFEDGLKSVILGEHSHTPYLGFKKYLSTIKRVLSWYNGEPWVKGTEAYKNMQITRKMHLAIRMKVCRMNNEQIDAACTFANPWCPDRELLMKDFAMTCPFEKFGQRPYIAINKSPYRPKGMNNSDMAAIQGIFIGLPLLYPENIGIYDAIDEDLEAFCHIWRCYGYFLGIEDEYNFCRGTLKEIRQRVRDFYQYWIIPNFKDMAPEWEHMTRCLVEPINYYAFVYMPYKVMTLIATDALNLNMPHLYASLSYSEWIAYKFYKFILRHVLRFSNTRAIANNVIHKVINKTMNFNPEKLAELHEKSKKTLPDFPIIY